MGCILSPFRILILHLPSWVSCPFIGWYCTHPLFLPGNCYNCSRYFQEHILWNIAFTGYFHRSRNRSWRHFRLYWCLETESLHQGNSAWHKDETSIRFQKGRQSNSSNIKHHISRFPCQLLESIDAYQLVWNLCCGYHLSQLRLDHFGLPSTYHLVW